MIKNSHAAFLIQSLILFLPINVYIVGDWVGCGIQWALFRYQVSYFGESLIGFTNEILYVYTGIIQGRSAIALIIWAIAATVLIFCFMVNIYAVFSDTPTLIQNTFLCSIIIGILFLLADLMQYGLSLHNSAGICIPIGVPAIILVGVSGYTFTKRTHQTASEFIPGFMEWPVFKENKNLLRLTDSRALQNLLVLIGISVLVKYILFFSSLYAPFDSVTGDILLYYHYAGLVVGGQIPYADFLLEYPPLLFIPAIIAYIPTILLHSFSLYLFSYMTLMYIFDAATLICVYFIARDFYGNKKAFLCGFLYVTAIAAAFFVPLTYDIVATFLLILSFFLFLNRNIVAAYFTATFGFLTKWFPVFTFPFYTIYAIKKQRDIVKVRNGILLSILAVLVVSVPFALLNWKGFLFTYTFHLNRSIQTHSMIYYGDAISHFFLNGEYFSPFSLVLLIVAETGLIFWYYRYMDMEYQSLCYALFLSVFFFILFNKVFSASYIVWITPFLALFLAHSPRHILLFYLSQLVIYIETPLLYGVVFGDGKPYYVIEQNFLSFSFVFYSIKFLILAVVLWIIMRDIVNTHKMMKRTD